MKLFEWWNNKFKKVDKYNKLNKRIVHSDKTFVTIPMEFNVTLRYLNIKINGPNSKPD